MEAYSEELGERIYDLVCGDIDLERAAVPESDIVQSEFEEGSPCAAAYGRMLEAYSRLCARLGTEEWNDADVEIVIDALREIGRRTSLKMFEYGLHYGRLGKG